MISTLFMLSALCVSSSAIETMSQKDLFSLFREDQIIKAQESISPEQPPRSNVDPNDLLKGPEISGYLSNTYGGAGWRKSNSHFADCGGMSDRVYKYPPREFGDPTIGNFYNILHAAEQAAGWNEPYIGCGRLALASQLDYLCRSCGYYEIGNPFNEEDYLIDLLTNVILETDGMSLGKYGTWVSVTDFIDAAETLLHLYGLDRELDIGTSSPYYDPFIIIDSPTLTWEWSSDYKMERIISSILGGMPVVWRTWLTAPQPYQAHYMNLYGYELWERGEGDDYESHTMFKLRVNWGQTDEIYADASWVLNSLWGTIICFKERYVHYGFEGDDLGFPCSYNNTPIQTHHVHGWNQCDITRLRVGEVNHYDEYENFDCTRLTMSSQRNDYTESYLKFEFDERAIQSDFLLSRWETDTFSSSDSLVIHRKGTNLDDPYPLPLNYLSWYYSNPSNIPTTFDDTQLEMDDLELHLHSDSTGDDRNRKRVCIQGISITTEEPYLWY